MGDPEPAVTTDDAWKQKMDYAWDWFKFHAKQRTDMFNFFLVVTALLINGYISLRKENLVILCLAVSVVGALSALGFLFLDIRNKELVDRSAALLEFIEKKRLFADAPGIWLCDHAKDQANTPFFLRRSTIFRGSQAVIALMWVLFAFALSWDQPVLSDSSAATPSPAASPASVSNALPRAARQ